MATQPVDAPISQYFGENPDSYRPFGLLAHEGQDFACPTGTPVRAALSGVVGIATSWPSSYGNVIIIHDINGGGEIYGHLLRFNVGVGQYVNEGDIIAWSNNTGNSTGAHLHFGWQPVYMSNLQNGYWGCADPRILLNQGGSVNPGYDQYKEMFKDEVIRGYGGRIPTQAERQAKLFDSPFDEFNDIVMNDQMRGDMVVQINRKFRLAIWRDANATEQQIWVDAIRSRTHVFADLDAALEGSGERRPPGSVSLDKVKAKAQEIVDKAKEIIAS